MCCGTDGKSSCNLKHIRGFLLTDYVRLVLACKLVPKRTREMGKNTSYTRLVGVRLNKQESLHAKPALGGFKTSTSPHPFVGI